MMTLNYGATPKFEKSFKRLTKKFCSLPEDFETVKRAAIELFHLKEIDNQSCFRLQGYDNPHCNFYKIKKFACKALKGKGVRSGMRVIYAHYSEEGRVEFVEIYYKQDQENENRELIKEYISALRSKNK